MPVKSRPDLDRCWSALPEATVQVPPATPSRVATAGANQLTGKPLSSRLRLSNVVAMRISIPPSVLVIAAIALAGCSGDEVSASGTTSIESNSARDTPSTPTSQSATSPSTASSTPSGETTAQWASKVAAARQEFPGAVKDYQDECTLLLGDEPIPPLCGALALTLKLQAQTVSIVLEKGEPPDEISQVVATTRGAAADVEATYEAEVADCPFPATAETCPGHNQLWQKATALENALVAWDPWL
jgi:hypothetical protein